MTLLGDYWFDCSHPLPSGAVVDLLEEFAIGTASARAALNRLTKRGLLVSSKRGRNTYYAFKPEAGPILRETLRGISAFGSADGRRWDGEWTIVAFSVPEAQRAVRHSIRRSLRWLGFAALYDGFWCSPWRQQDEALAMLSDLGVVSASVQRVRINSRSTVQAVSAWDLDAVRGRYGQFEAEFAPILTQAQDGRLTSSEALIVRTMVMDHWRSFVGVAPDLPVEVLPDDWPHSRMHDLFTELYEDLAPVAVERCRQILAEYSPELAALVVHHDLHPDSLPHRTERSR